MKFGTQTNSHVQNSMVMLTFSVFDQKYPFLVSLVHNCQFELKFGTYSNLIMQNSMVVFTFPFSTENTFFVQIWSKISKWSVRAEIQYLD